MTFLSKPILGLLLGALMLLAGCTTNPNNSGIPWSRPAGWEGQVPGMDGGMGR